MCNLVRAFCEGIWSSFKPLDDSPLVHVPNDSSLVCFTSLRSEDKVLVLSQRKIEFSSLSINLQRMQLAVRRCCHSGTKFGARNVRVGGTLRIEVG